MCRICDDRIPLRGVVLCKLPYQTKVEITPRKNGLLLLKLLFAAHVECYPSRICRELLECHKVPSLKSCVVFVRPIILPRGYVSFDWRWTRPKKVRLPVMRGNKFLSPFKTRVELIRPIGRCPHIQRRLVAARYRTGHPDRCPRLTADHRHHHRMLALRHQIWNHQWYLLTSPGPA